VSDEAGAGAAPVVDRLPEAPPGGDVGALRFDATLPRGIVHKAAIEQVLLSDAVRLGELEFACATQLARAHSYYSDLLLPIYDPLVLLEVSRQAVVLGSHEYFGVPPSWQFIFSDIRGTIHDARALEVGTAPVDCVVLLALEEARYRRGELSSGRFRARWELGGTTAATLVGTATFFSRERYGVLRKTMRKWIRPEPPSAPPVPLSPAEVGRASTRNVVVGAPVEQDGSHVCGVIVDESHATFFDHPLDHVPGALLIEAFRQTAVAAACSAHGLRPERALVAEYAAEYSRLGELGASIRCSAHVGAPSSEDGAERVAVDLTLEQFGTSISEARFVLAFLHG
jgi:hypothetical protein